MRRCLIKQCRALYQPAILHFVLPLSPPSPQPASELESSYFKQSSVSIILNVFRLPLREVLSSIHSDLFMYFFQISISQFSSVSQPCPTLCNPEDCSTPGSPVHHQHPELAQTHVQVGDVIQPSHPLLSPSPPAFNLSKHQGLSILYKTH